MRGCPNPQRSMLAIVDPGNGFPRTIRCGRRIKEVANAALVQLSQTFDRMYASVLPEQLLKSSPLIVLYLVLGAQRTGARVQPFAPLVPGHGPAGA